MATSKLPKVSISKLRQLVRLHRRGIAGAKNQLAELLEARPDDVLDAVGMSPLERSRVLDADDPVETIVEAIETRPELTRLRRAEESLRRAVTLASQLARDAVRDGEFITLSVGCFRSLVLSGGYDRLAFNVDGLLGVVERHLVARMLRWCRNADLDAVTVGPRGLTLTYRTVGSRGRVCFRLLGGRLGRAVVVDLTPAPAPVATRFLDRIFGAVGEAVA